MSEPWIQFKNWSFRYRNGHSRALKDINLTLNHGEKVLVLGANASGKTTFIRALRDQLGKGDFAGESDGQIIRDHRNLKTIDGTRIVSAMDQVDSEEDIMHLDWSRFGDQAYVNQNYDHLSSGEQDVLDLMADVNYEESVFVFDEPLANLSPETAHVFLDLLDDFSYGTNATIVLAGYRLEQTLYRPIDRVIVLNEGRVVFDGNADQLLKSEILHTFYIREPLYVSAIRYAGYPLAQVRNIANVNHIYGRQLKETIERWLLSVPNFIYPQSEEEVLRFEEISYRFPYRDVDTIKKLSVRFNKSEIVSVVGGNGAGKTTLSKLINGDLAPTSGHIYWQGEEVTTENQVAFLQCVTYISHNPWEKLKAGTVKEQLRIAGEEAGLSESEMTIAIDKNLSLLGLRYATDFPIHYLSYGQLKRVQLAQALMRQSEVLIIDEPTEGQDYYHYNELMQYIYTLAQQQQLLVIINSHDIDLALEFTQRTLVMQMGHIIADTLPLNVASSPHLLKAAALDEPSLYTFAKRIHLVDPYNFIRKFTNYNRAINQ